MLFDAAHALGCSYRKQRIGGFGNAEVLSFHATKFVNSFEGGAVCTNDDELAGKMRLMRNFGFAGPDRVVHIGTNGKMSEVCAAMGITSLESIDRFIAVNRRNYQDYCTGLGTVPGIRILTYDESAANSYQYIVIEVEETKAGLNRNQLQAVLTADNVLARRYFYPGCHRMEPYRSLFPQSHLWLPTTEHISGRVLVLPTGTALTAGEIQAICQIIRTALDQSREVIDALNNRENGIPSHMSR